MSNAKSIAMNLNRFLFPGRYKREREQQESDRRILDNLNRYRYLTGEEISKRLKKLQNEWDIEKTLKINASAIAVAGFILKRLTRRRGFWFTGALAGLVWHHGVRKWAMSLPVIRRMGKRTQEEINDEIFSLKILRGDFDHINGTTDPELILRAMRT
jgi:hypothetical protein